MGNTPSRKRDTHPNLRDHSLLDQDEVYQQETPLRLLAR